ncbi:hypothetical protein F383_26892 [Gossypium arboreum]|uniref:Uncharacterized protein n=1 Tax=Gossypium arboreum TaxID=29729 RepID=A0A0B0P1W1_GOSAR|nr:hypothetical protein F383_26892 [Gossypium arboreum]
MVKLLVSMKCLSHMLQSQYLYDICSRVITFISCSYLCCLRIGNDLSVGEFDMP